MLMQKQSNGRVRSGIVGWLAKGPFAIIAASLQGGVNYLIILYLSFSRDLSATGEYRTLFSYYSLLALASMPESNKVFIKAVVADDVPSATALFINRLACGFAVLAAIVVTRLITDQMGHPMVSSTLLGIALLSAIVYPFDLYIALLQAQRRFRMLVLVECIRYGGALACFMSAIASGKSITYAIFVQLGFMGLSMAVFYIIFSRDWLDLALVRKAGFRLVGRPASRQARALSFANFLPSSLDSVDKLAVGKVFGLHVLGVYTLAYSTGRFLYNILKPAMYVYYRRFVDAMPGWPLLRRVSGGFTLFGAVTAVIFLVLVAYVPAMAKFEEGKWTTVILFLSYGVGILSAVYGQAFALNKETNAAHAVLGNAFGTLVALGLMCIALLQSWPIAAVLLALQYPVRDGLSVLMLHWLRSRQMQRSVNG